MKRIIIALGVVAVLAAGAVTVWANVGHPSVATAAGSGQVPRTEVEQRATEDFSYPGDAPESMSCPSGLPAKKGAVVRCTAAFAEESKTMEVTAAKVEGDQVSLGYGLLERR